MSDPRIDESIDAIAIVGMAGRFPGATTLRQFWENLRDGVEGVTFFDDAELGAAGESRALIDHPKYVKARAVLEDVDLFDAEFFGFTPREAELMDPQHRLFLECAWEALEDAGYVPEGYEGVIGVFGSTLMSSYLLANLYPNQELMEASGALAVRIATDRDFLPTRVSFKLDLKGPSFCVQTACSSTLVGCHLAIKSLLDYECDIALVGGVSISLPQERGYLYHEGGIYSPDGHCRAFDAEARGTVVGSGMGIVVLKRLDDALNDGDTIRAVIRGSAINNDGSLKMGYTAPSIEAQAEVVTMAQTVAKVDPQTVSYIEAHGTGTSLGDLVEVTALTQVFRESSDENQFCAIGSVKTNIGHLDAAAGIAGLIKAALALQHKQIPPSLGYEQPNPEIDFANSPFRVNATLSDWPAGSTPRRAGVSSFAVGGTNAHVVLEEAPAVEADAPARQQHLLVLSARSTAALDQATDQLATQLEQQPSVQIADVAYTLQRGRRAFDERRVVVCSDTADALQALRTRDPQRVFSSAQPVAGRSIVFMFPGQGAQYVNMGRDLYEHEPVFRAEVDRCAQKLRPQLGLDLREMLYPTEQRAATAAQQLGETWLTQPAVFVIEYALAQLWISWGVAPAAMIGHSIGEYVAACLGGVFSLDDALALVATRGRLMQTLPTGAMLSVSLPAGDVEPLLREIPQLSLAAINGPALCVVAGPSDAIESLQTRLSDNGVTSRRLHTSHAFHSAMMDPIVPAFVERVRRVRLQAPQIPYLSNITGTWITAQQATDPHYWAQHLRQPVRFAEGLAALLGAEGSTAQRALLEVGPGRTLSTFARQQTPAVSSAIVATSLRHPQESISDVAFLLTALGQLWLGGTAIDWSALYSNERRLRVPLPTYPFERRRYWVEPPTQAEPAPAHSPSDRKQIDIADWFYAPIWKESRLPQSIRAQAEPLDHWIVLTETSELGQALARQLSDLGHQLIVGHMSSAWNIAADGSYSINPAQHADVQALLDASSVQEGGRLHIVVALNAPVEPQSNNHHDLTPRCDLAGLITFIQTLGRVHLPHHVDLTALTVDAQDVLGTESLALAHAPVTSLMQAFAHAWPQLNCRSLDVSSHDALGRRQLHQVIAEIATESGADPVAYRSRRRWLQAVEPQRVERPTVPAARLPARGVYLLTDALNSVSLALAEYLAQTVQARLVLLGPAELPAREQWSQVQAAGAASLANAIRRLESLEQAGSELLVIPTEVTAAALQQAIIQAQLRWGQIDGVVHGIGSSHHSDPSVEQVLLALDETCRHLEALAAPDPASLDFVLLHAPLSSLLKESTDLVGVGRIALMNAFARQRSQHVATDWLSVVWDQPSDDEADAWTMDQAETVEVFGRILANRSGQPLIVATGNLLARRARAATQEAPAALAATPTATHYARPALPTAYVEPSTPLEHALVTLWQDLLGIAPIGIHDPFFALGGHSLLATQIISRIRDTLHVTLSLNEFFDAATIAGIAQQITTAIATTDADQPTAIPVASRDGTLPLSFAQQQLWFLHQIDPASTAYTMPFAVHLSGTLNYTVLERSITAIVERHEVLRTTFGATDGRPHQVIHPAQGVPLPLFDLEPLPAIEQQGELQRRIAEEVERPFDLESGPLLRVMLLRLNTHEHVLALMIHHIIFDGWSMSVFTSELAALYRAFADHEASSLPDLPIQYVDYAVWQRAQVQMLEAQRAYWQRQLAHLPVQALPLARTEPRPNMQRSAQQTFALSAAATAQLKVLSEHEGVTLFMILLAVFTVLQHHHTQQTDLVIGTDVANRTHSESEALIGFFVNQLVLRTDVSGDPTFRDLLQRVRSVALAAYDHQDLPFQRVVDAVQPDRNLDRTPLFQIKLVLQNLPATALDLPELRLSQVEVINQTARFDLFLSLAEVDHQIQGVADYNSDVFEATAIARLLMHYTTLLEQLPAQPDLTLTGASGLLVELERQLQRLKAEQLKAARLEKFKKIKR